MDDIVDVVEEEATEDIQKFGGVEALEAPYLDVGFFGMVRKRAGWLLVLFLGEMLSASAMGRFEGVIASAVVLALFVPLIISSGGNSGSQASTLVPRASVLAPRVLSCQMNSPGSADSGAAIACPRSRPLRGCRRPSTGRVGFPTASRIAE